MLEWSDVDIAVRDAVREFVDKEVRPHVDALESGEMEPYPIIRKLFATFGIADMARDSLNKRLARLRDGGQSSEKPSSGGMFGGDGASAGMGFVVVSELCRVSMGVVTGMGVSLGLTVPTIMGRGTLAQQERWLPDLVTYDKVGGREVQMPFHFTAEQLQKLLSPHFVIEQLRDSYFYSSVLDDPARARFVILRNNK